MGARGAMSGKLRGQGTRGQGVQNKSNSYCNTCTIRNILVTFYIRI